MREDQEVHQFNTRTGFVGSAGGGDSLELYFSERLLAPVNEWQKEAATNKEFYLGEKSFDYISTIAGHEPVIEFPDGMNCPSCGNEAMFIRDRGFKDGSGRVHTCTNESCKSYNLYFYPDERV